MIISDAGRWRHWRPMIRRVAGAVVVLALLAVVSYLAGRYGVGLWVG